MSFLLSTTSKLASFVRYGVTAVGMLYVGLQIGSQEDVDGVLSGVEAVFTNFDALIAAGAGVVAAVLGVVNKVKAFIKPE